MLNSECSFFCSLQTKRTFTFYGSLCQTVMPINGGVCFWIWTVDKVVYLQNLQMYKTGKPRFYDRFENRSCAWQGIFDEINLSWRRVNDHKSRLRVRHARLTALVFARGSFFVYVCLSASIRVNRFLSWTLLFVSYQKSFDRVKYKAVHKKNRWMHSKALFG